MKKPSVLFLLGIAFSCAPPAPSGSGEMKITFDEEKIPLSLRADSEIELKGSLNTIDMDYKWTYTVPDKEVFSVVRSDGKEEKFVGSNFDAKFFFYSKLLTVEYLDDDSLTHLKHYNNPISWTSEPVK
ncbi:MAG: hypothetical protein MI810_23985 [Flavobacteriales bacterium]|nr:hypothetical protein [Flavobacteriales bacterium]